MGSAARIAYTSCPLCDAPVSGEAFLVADCSAHELYHPSLPREMRWMRCGACGHVHTDGYFTAEAMQVVMQRTQENQRVGWDLEGQRAVSARMIARVQPFVTDGRWLDVGYGNASLLFTAQELGFEPEGIELREDNVAALAGADVDAACLDLAALDRPERYRVVSLCDVLEHTPFPRVALAAARRSLTSDGVLFLSMPNADSALWRALDAAGRNPYWAELEHFHNFGRKRLYALLEENGFRPVAFGISERYRACMEVVARRD